MLWISLLIALAAGAANPFQAGANAELNKHLQQPMLAGLWVYLSGLAALFFAALLMRELSPAVIARASIGVQRVPWWAWCGGVVSLGSTLAGLTLAQKLGSGVFTALTVTAALLTSVLLDQFGVMGFRQHTASPSRLLGCGMLVAGVWLVSRS